MNLVICAGHEKSVVFIVNCPYTCADIGCGARIETCLWKEPTSQHSDGV